MALTQRYKIYETIDSINLKYIGEKELTREQAMHMSSQGYMLEG